MEELTFKIRLSVQDLYYFMMYHYYTSFAGVFGIFLSLAAAVALCLRFSSMGNTERLLFFLVAIAFIIINPLWLRMKAGAQIRRNHSLGDELTYMLSSQQLAIRMGEEQADIPWTQIVRVKDNGRELVVYVTAARGYIWPKYQLGAEYDRVVAALKQNVAARRLHLKE